MRGYVQTAAATADNTALEQYNYCGGIAPCCVDLFFYAVAWRGVVWHGVAWCGVVAWAAVSGVTSLMCELALALGITSSTSTTATTGRLAGVASSRSASVTAVEVLAKPTHNPLRSCETHTQSALQFSLWYYVHVRRHTITTMIVPSPSSHHPYYHT